MAHSLGADEAHHHPGQGLAVAQISPSPILAHDAKHHIIEAMCVLHGFLLGKRPGVEDPSDHEGRRMGEYAFLLMLFIMFVVH